MEGREGSIEEGEKEPRAASNMGDCTWSSSPGL
jgi:hypothetical protein